MSRRSSVIDGPPSELDVAHHEVGHALIACALGYRLHAVALTPGSEELGRVETFCLGRPDLAAVEYDLAHGDREARRRARAGAVWEALFAGAGFAAEALRTDAPRWRLPLLIDPVEDHGDLRRWNEALHLAGGGSYGSAVRGASWCAALLHRYMVERVALLADLADLLVRERAIAGDAFRAAVHESVARRGVDVFAPALLSTWWQRPATDGGAR